jgi:hypothetical protein
MTTRYGCFFQVSREYLDEIFLILKILAYYGLKLCILHQNHRLRITVNYHQFILGSNNVWFLNIANITLTSLWAVASTAIL